MVAAAARRGGDADPRLLPYRGQRGASLLALPSGPLQQRLANRAALVHARSVRMNALTAIPYAEFGIQSNFSFLRGASKPEELVVTAKFYGFSSIGLADRNTVAGVVRASQQAKVEKQAYHPGCRLVFRDGTPDILAYPQDRKGWGHLCRMLTQANLRDENEKGATLLELSDLLEWGDLMSLAILPNLSARAQDNLALINRLKDRFGTALRLAVAPDYGGNDRFRVEQAAAMAEHARV